MPSRHSPSGQTPHPVYGSEEKAALPSLPWRRQRSLSRRLRTLCSPLGLYWGCWERAVLITASVSLANCKGQGLSLPLGAAPSYGDGRRSTWLGVHLGASGLCLEQEDGPRPQGIFSLMPRLSRRDLGREAGREGEDGFPRISYQDAPGQLQGCRQSWEEAGGGRPGPLRPGAAGLPGGPSQGLIG